MAALQTGAAPRRACLLTVSRRAAERAPRSCFLNSALQCLWHLESFRTRLQESCLTVDGAVREVGGNSVYAHLKALFAEYAFGASAVLPPDRLREVLSVLYASERRFLVGGMGDATEAMEAILEHIHEEEMALAGDDAPAAALPESIAHSAFGIQLLEQKVCRACGATSEPMVTTELVYRVYTEDILGAARRESLQASEINLSSILARTIAALDSQQYSCPSRSSDARMAAAKRRARSNSAAAAAAAEECAGKSVLHRHLLKAPPVFSIALVWPGHRTTRDIVRHVLHAITGRLYLTAVFRRAELLARASTAAGAPSALLAAAPAAAPPAGAAHLFSGMICYYGRHYMTFFYSRRLRVWLLLDDAKVVPCGSWAAVADKCIAGCLQPTVIFYERLSGAAIAEDVRMAPAPPSPEHLSEARRQLRLSVQGAGEGREGSGEGAEAARRLEGAFSEEPLLPEPAAPALRPSSSAGSEEFDRAVVADPGAFQGDCRDEAKGFAAFEDEPPAAPAEQWGRDHDDFEIVLPLAFLPENPSRGLLGIRLDGFSMGRAVIVDFYRHPRTGEVMAAEAQGQLHLMDELVAAEQVDGARRVDLRGKDQHTLSALITDRAQLIGDEKMVSLTFRRMRA